MLGCNHISRNIEMLLQAYWIAEKQVVITFGVTGGNSLLNATLNNTSKLDDFNFSGAKINH